MSNGMEKARDNARKGIEFDEKRDYDRAQHYYEAAVSILLQEMKNVQDASTKARLWKDADRYLTRLEELKKRVVPDSITTSGSRKPDDYDYTAGRRTNVSATSSNKRLVSSSGGGGGAAAAVGGAASAGRGKKIPPADNVYETTVMNEMLDRLPGTRWEDIAGLEDAKQTLQEAVILPNLRPDLFRGLRSPPRGVLLFGPPGTGKTMLAKAVASESGFAFFSISASSLVSKYLGDGEKMVRALFSVARKQQPSVIFIDEIDSILSTRNENEHEASRRLKTEFLIQIDGVGADNEDRVLVMAATNLPWTLDEAILRRLSKKVYIPLPDARTREALVRNLLRTQKHSLTKPAQLNRLIAASEGYSCSDLTAICKEAAMAPIRELDGKALTTIKESQLRALTLDDFLEAMRIIRPSITSETIEQFNKWRN